jgi:cytoskeletal protein RodZ
MEEVTKKEEITKTSREPQNHKWLWPVIIILLLLLLLLWWAAAYYNWGPFKDKAADTSSNTGTSSQQNAPATNTGGTSGSSGATGATGATGTTGSSTTATPATSTSSSSILDFSLTVNNGDTKEEVSGQASGLTQNCTLTVNSTTAGKQEVCTYSDGSKIVTVTYLNDQVVNVSRSGF